MEERSLIVYEQIPMQKDVAREMAEMLWQVAEEGMPRLSPEFRERIGYCPPESADSDWDNEWRHERKLWIRNDNIQLIWKQKGLEIYADRIRPETLEMVAEIMAWVMEKHGLSEPAIIHASYIDDLFWDGLPGGEVYAIGPGIVRKMGTDEMGMRLADEIRQELETDSQAPMF